MVTLLKGYDNFCSTAFLTGQGQFRMMYSHDMLYYGQSKASSSRLLGTALVYAVEPLKHSALKVVVAAVAARMVVPITAK